MRLNSAKKITRRSWYTILMPDTVISRLNELACNKPNRFIFTERRGSPIGDADITGVDKDTNDINKNKAPQDPPHEFQEIEKTEEEPVIPDPKIDLNINHETPTEKLNTEEQPEYHISIAVQPPMNKKNRPHHPIAVVHKYAGVRTHTNSYTPSM